MSEDQIVLDASALLALLNGEPGQEVVLDHLAGAVIGAVNLAEVVGKLVDAGVPKRDARDAISEIGLTVVDLDQALAFTAGALRASTRRLGLSLGDRACLFPKREPRGSSGGLPRARSGPFDVQATERYRFLGCLVRPD